MTKPIFSRILLKLSGEGLAGEKGFGLDPIVANKLASEIKSVKDLGVNIGIVIGGGNIIRGELAEVQGMDRVSADYFGMLATIINSITLQDALEKNNCETRTLSALSISQLAEPYIRRRAIRHLEKNRVIILAGGSGTRMSPLTKAVNKQLLPIYDKPLIFYPLSILMLSKIKDILIIVNKGQVNQYKKLIPNGKNLGLNIFF